MAKLFIIGAGEPALEIAEIVEAQADARGASEIVGFFDERRTGPRIFNDTADIPAGASFVCSIGEVAARERLYGLMMKAGFTPTSVVAGLSWISPTAKLGAGIVVYPFCAISTNVEVAENVLLNFHVSLSHGTTIGANCNISPGVCIAGNVNVGSNVFLGAGSVVREKTRICDNAYIGANATVVKDITEPGIYAGTPCKLLKPL